MSMVVYFLKVSVALVLFWLMYRLVFKKLTFFAFNRFLLIGSVALSFLLPLMRLKGRPLNQSIVDYSLGIDWEQITLVPLAMEPAASVSSAGYSLGVLLWIYFIVVACFVIKGIIGLYKTRRNFAQGYKQRESGITYYVNRNVKLPFTLFRTIYLDPYTYKKGLTPVIRHEMVHARQLHSIDLIFMEIACAFLWFNPFVFLFRRYIRANHEYLADNQANESREELIQYMQTLSETLSRSVHPVYASFFSSSPIKNRIIMLTNKKSRSHKKFLYLLAIPVIALAVMSFQQPVENVLNESAMLQIDLQNASSSSIVEEPGIPSRFPLGEKYKDGVTWDYNTKHKHPITNKLVTHTGIDFKAPKGTLIYAAGSGVIARSEDHKSYGKLIVIQHVDGYTSLYSHLDERFVSVGEKVKIGQTIGTVGNTGLSSGDHLHYEVRKDGENVNPADYY